MASVATSSEATKVEGLLASFGQPDVCTTGCGGGGVFTLCKNDDVIVQALLPDLDNRARAADNTAASLCLQLGMTPVTSPQSDVTVTPSTTPGTNYGEGCFAHTTDASTSVQILSATNVNLQCQGFIAWRASLGHKDWLMGIPSGGITGAAACDVHLGPDVWAWVYDPKGESPNVCADLRQHAGQGF